MDTVKWKGTLTSFCKKYRYMLLVVAVGFVLMLLPSGKQQEAPSQGVPVTQTASNPSEELEQILSQIHGVGRVKVLLSVSSGEQTIYEINEDRSDSGESSSHRTDTVLITDGSRGEQGLVQQVISPTYRGAIIVCQGGDQSTVRLAVVEAVSDVTGLTADKISVLKMK